MSPEPFEVAPLPEVPQPEVYPFWGYLDLLGFVLIALFGSVVESLLMAALMAAKHIKQIYVLMPAQLFSM